MAPITEAARPHSRAVLGDTTGPVLVIGLFTGTEQITQPVEAGIARQIAARFEADVEQGRISLEDLFDRQYQAIPGTQPPKFHTRFDRYTDQVLPAIQEPLLPRHEGLVFAIACTQQGYVPTHNLAFSQPLTGDDKVDAMIIYQLVDGFAYVRL